MVPEHFSELALKAKDGGAYFRRLMGIMDPIITRFTKGDDDLKQAAYIGLWQALRKTDGRPGFFAYALLAIRKGIVREIHRKCAIQVPFRKALPVVAEFPERTLGVNQWYEALEVVDFVESLAPEAQEIIANRIRGTEPYAKRQQLAWRLSRYQVDKAYHRQHMCTLQ